MTASGAGSIRRASGASAPGSTPRSPGSRRGTSAGGRATGAARPRPADREPVPVRHPLGARLADHHDGHVVARRWAASGLPPPSPTGGRDATRRGRPPSRPRRAMSPTRVVKPTRTTTHHRRPDPGRHSPSGGEARHRHRPSRPTRPGRCRDSQSRRRQTPRGIMGLSGGPASRRQDTRSSVRPPTIPPGPIRRGASGAVAALRCSPWTLRSRSPGRPHTAIVMIYHHFGPRPIRRPEVGRPARGVPLPAYGHPLPRERARSLSAARRRRWRGRPPVHEHAGGVHLASPSERLEKPRPEPGTRMASLPSFRLGEDLSGDVRDRLVPDRSDQGQPGGRLRRGGRARGAHEPGPAQVGACLLHPQETAPHRSAG